MKQILFFILILFLPLTALRAQRESKAETVKKHKIAVCVVASNPSDTCAQSLIESARRFFCIQQDVVYFVFTGGVCVNDASDVIKIHHLSLEEPYSDLKKVHALESRVGLFKSFDYLFMMDPEMVFVAPVGDEVLSNLTATQHPAFLNKRGPYENRKESAAYIAPTEGQHYFTGQFFGGRQKEFIDLIRTIKRQVDTDLARDFIARGLFESHLNRYLVQHKPTKILNPSYAYPQDWQLGFPKKIVTSSKRGEAGGVWMEREWR